MRAATGLRAVWPTDVVRANRMLRRRRERALRAITTSGAYGRSIPELVWRLGLPRYEVAYAVRCLVRLGEITEAAHVAEGAAPRYVAVQIAGGNMVEDRP